MVNDDHTDPAAIRSPGRTDTGPTSTAEKINTANRSAGLQAKALVEQHQYHKPKTKVQPRSARPDDSCSYRRFSSRFTCGIRFFRFACPDGCASDPESVDRRLQSAPFQKTAITASATESMRKAHDRVKASLHMDISGNRPFARNIFRLSNLAVHFPWAISISSRQSSTTSLWARMESRV